MMKHTQQAINNIIALARVSEEDVEDVDVIELASKITHEARHAETALVKSAKEVRAFCDYVERMMKLNAFDNNLEATLTTLRLLLKSLRELHTGMELNPVVQVRVPDLPKGMIAEEHYSRLK
jgi:hypothetical protein